MGEPKSKNQVVELIPSQAIKFAYLARGCGSIYFEPDMLSDDAPFDVDVSVEDSLKPEVQKWLNEHSAQIMWTISAYDISRVRKEMEVSGNA